MTTSARGASPGPSGRALGETLAETGPGLSDEAVLEGELAPGELEKGADAALERLRRKGWTSLDEGRAASSQPGDPD